MEGEDEAGGKGCESCRRTVKLPSHLFIIPAGGWRQQFIIILKLWTHLRRPDRGLRSRRVGLWIGRAAAQGRPGRRWRRRPQTRPWDPGWTAASLRVEGQRTRVRTQKANYLSGQIQILNLALLIIPLVTIPASSPGSRPFWSLQPLRLGQVKAFTLGLCSALQNDRLSQ